MVLLVLSFITPVFERVPYNAMGAIVLSSVLGLFELSEALFLFKANFLDFLVWLAAFLGTIFLGVEIGLGIAIGLAIVLVVYQSAFPHTAVLGRLPETRARYSALARALIAKNGVSRLCRSGVPARSPRKRWRAEVYRNIKQYPSAQQTPHIVVVRVDAPIYFANVEWIRSRVAKYRDRNGADKRLGPVHYIVLDMAPVPFVDSTGAPPCGGGMQCAFLHDLHGTGQGCFSSFRRYRAASLCHAEKTLAELSPGASASHSVRLAPVARRTLLALQAR